MNVNELNAIVKITSRFSNRSSLSTLYRSLELSDTTLRLQSDWGNIEMSIPPTGIKSPSLIDAVALGTLSTYPPEAEIEFTEKDNKIYYRIGRARGCWDLVSCDHKIQKLKHDVFPWAPPEHFADALRVASSACEAAAVSAGLYGIVIDPKFGKLNIMSSNRTALAAATIDGKDYPVEHAVTLRPPIPKLIALILDSFRDCMMDVSEKGVYIRGDGIKAFLPFAAGLEQDLGHVADKFQSHTTEIQVDSIAIKKFITRARALTDRKVSFTVGIKIEKGQLILQHRGIASEMEEEFIAEGASEDINYNSISYSADMLLEPLEYVQSIVLDYLPNQQLVLRGKDPEFIFVVGGD